MVDVIIPAYNAHKTIKKTLLSIASLDNLNDIKTYIVNDASETDYSEEVKEFKNLINIKELKLSKNSGPALARQYGIDHSNSKYIIFMDADDEFYDEKSVSVLINNIKGYDLVKGVVYIEEKNGGYYDYNDEFTLHGKLYKRSIIDKYNIKFNPLNSKKAGVHEDNSFNNLYELCCKKINNIEDVVYFYKYIPTSITKANTDEKSHFKNYVYAMDWLAREVEKRNLKNGKAIAEKFCFMLFNCFMNYLYDYNYYSFMFKELSNIKRLYLENEGYLEYMEKASIYNVFYTKYKYNIIPSISFYEFLNMIE